MTLMYLGDETVDKPSTCMIDVPTNLSWDNYTFSGTIVKPEGDEYDSVGISLVFYDNGTDNYKLSVRGAGNGGNQFLLERNDVVLDTLPVQAFEGIVDSLSFEISIENKKEEAENLFYNKITISLYGETPYTFTTPTIDFISKGKTGVELSKTSNIKISNIEVKKHMGSL